jgi:hypothetical protein
LTLGVTYLVSHTKYRTTPVSNDITISYCYYYYFFWFSKPGTDSYGYGCMLARAMH